MQNAAPNNGAPAGQAAAPGQDNQGWGAWPVPPAPPLPPFLMNYQAWLAEQGLNVQDGLVPENNLVDSAPQAWNDSITLSDDSSSAHSALAMIIASDADTGEHMISEEQLIVSVEMHNHGIRFGLSAQGDHLMTLLLADPLPRQQLNRAIFSALRPLLATMGPWSHGYGLRQENLQVEIQVTIDTEGIQFNQLRAQHNSMGGTAVQTSEIVEPALNNTLAITGPEEIDLQLAFLLH